MNKFILLLVLFLPANKLSLANEVEEVKKLAPKYNAEVEVILWDNTRVDLLNDEYAIEVDWAPKYAEGCGQSLYYSILTNRKPGVILLVTDIEKERRYIYRMQTIAAKYGIKVWVEHVKEEE